MSSPSSPVPQRPWGGRADEFAALFHGFHSLILSLAYRRLGDYHLAQDAAQLTFITAFRNLASLRNPEAFRGWLCRIAVSQCGRVRRGEQGPEQDQLTDVCDDLPSPCEALAQRELAALATRLLDRLPHGKAEILRRYYLGRESTATIARAMDLPRTTVKKRLYDGRRHLRRLFDTYLGSSRLDPLTDPAPIPPIAPLPGSR